MFVSYAWLKKYVDFDLTPTELEQVLTSIGLEVSGLEERTSVRGGLRGLVIGHVCTCIEHPNSDHLHITTVDIGKGDPLNIVCGAPNVAAGEKVVVATIGTELYQGDESFTIKKGKIRGEVSEGMLCAADEIGLGGDHSGIMVLDDDAAVGTPAAEYFGVTTDYVIEVDITPNRVDATSHYGVARDLYAYLKSHGYETALRKPDLSDIPLSNEEPIKLSLEAPEACHRYMGLVIKDMQVAESPRWLKDRLAMIGQRSINNVVDVANYVLFELGQPLHTFDLSKVDGESVRVRFATEGESLTLLDGTTIELTPKDLVIADEHQPMCLAGVMGGVYSGVTEETHDMFLEVATFHPTYVRKSARRFGISSDASFRYERGLDPNQLPEAMQRAVGLILEVTGGRVASKVYDIYPTEQKPYRVSLSLNKLHDLTGLDIPKEKTLLILDSLDIKVVEDSNDVLQLEVPRYRYDVTRDIDVVEEILRIYGYNEYPKDDHLSSTISVKSPTDISVAMQKRISEQLTGAGFNEILNNSLSKASYYTEEIQKKQAVQVMNPLSNDLSTMRMTLMYGGLETINFNLNRQASGIRLYEFGNCYRIANEEEKTDLNGYREDFRLGVWMTGDQQSTYWNRKDYTTSVFELKAVVLNVLSRMGLTDREFESTRETDTRLFDACEVLSLRGGGEIARWGLVHQEILKRMDIDCPVYFAEIEWHPIMQRVTNKEIKLKPIARFPIVKRDFALLINKEVSFADIERISRKAGGKLVKTITLFDVYEDSRHLEEGMKSYAVTFGLQNPEETLSDKQIDKIMNKIYEALNKELGATLR